MLRGKKRVLCCALCVALLGSFWTLGLSFAGNEQDKLNDINNQKNQAQSELSKGQKEAKALREQIQNLESQINEAQKEIGNLQGSIEKTRANIAQSEKNLKAVQDEMTKQNENMNDRLVAMYKNDDVSMLEVLLGSADVSEFLTNLDMVQRIYESDIELLKVMEEQYKKIEQQKKELDALKNTLVAQQQEAAAKQDNLEANQDTVEGKKADVEKNNAALSQQIADFNREAAALEAQIRALQGDSVYSGGQLSWPVPGVTRITDVFGYRTHPILNKKELHTGLDIGAPRNTTVVAAAEGTVIKAGWNNSYGNVVMIDHGSGMVTVYAHNTSLLVSTGDRVTREKPIAKSGSTGMSTGPHVHFEVRINGKYVDPKGYL